MTPDCDGENIPRDCASAFGAIGERLARVETTVQEIRAHQQSTLRRVWDMAKLAAIFLGGWLTGK